MRELLPHIDAWRLDGQSIAVATVVETWGSSPRPLGAKMVIGANGNMAGSVSGGCVESAVAEGAQRVLESAKPELMTFGVSNEQAWAVGLSCGGRLSVFVEPLADGDEPLFQLLRQRLEQRALVASSVVLSGREIGRRSVFIPGDLHAPTIDDAVADPIERGARDLARSLFESHGSRRASVDTVANNEAGERVEIFVEVLAPPPRLLMVGAVHVSVALTHLANVLGFETHVIDPRTAFATAARFGHADHLSHDWPDQAIERIGIDDNTFIAVLSHDPKLDLPALRVALDSKARYIGALGSKKTHRQRLQALREDGYTDEVLARIQSPIGLDLGGRRAEDIALAVLAEMVSVTHGKHRDGRSGS